jgi:hypothetical protein
MNDIPFWKQSKSQSRKSHSSAWPISTIAAFLGLATVVFDGFAQVSPSVAGVGIHYDSATTTFVARSELLVIGSNFWSAASAFNQASATMEFSTTGLDQRDEHYIGFEETGFTSLCPGVPNQFRLYGYVGNGQTDVSDRERTNTFLLTFETPRGYSQSNGLLNVSSFINDLIGAGHRYAGFVILPANECAFEGFGYARHDPNNTPQVSLVSASNPPRLRISVPSSIAVELSWVEVPAMTKFKLQRKTELESTNGWLVTTNLTSEFTNYIRTVRVERTNDPAQFFRLSN